MNKKGQEGLGDIILVFIAVIIGIAMIAQVFTTQNLVTEKQTASNDSISTSTAYVSAQEANESVNHTIYSQSDWKIASCPLSSVTLRNGIGTELTLDTDYTLYTSQGTFSLLNTTDTIPATALNLTYADYTFCDDGYNVDSGSRAVAGLWGLFGALIILGAAVYGARRWWS